MKKPTRLSAILAAIGVAGSNNNEVFNSIVIALLPLAVGIDAVGAGLAPPNPPPAAEEPKVFTVLISVLIG